jgi:hypothetical protein
MGLGDGPDDGQPEPRTLGGPAGNPQAYVQLRAGHSQGAITERYIHAAQVLFPGAAQRGEDRIFGELGDKAIKGLSDRPNS